MNTIIRTIRDIVRQAAEASLELFKVMIPIIIGVKILQELGLIGYLAWPLKPIMGLVGLPAEMGLVWATALVNNIYTGIIVLASLIQDHPLTGAQATVLAVLLLVGHGLPVECAIARRSGARFLFSASPAWPVPLSSPGCCTPSTTPRARSRPRPSCSSTPTRPLPPIPP